MKKQVILRGALGIPLGIAIGYLISIGISLVYADGYFAPCVPELATVMGNEINAVILQTLLCGLLGASFAATSAIWNIDRWGVGTQTCVYFVINAVVMMLTAYFTYWMEHSIKGFISYFMIFVQIFIIVWLIQFFIGRRIVKQMNIKLKNVK